VTDSKELDPATQFKQLYDQEYLSVYRSIRGVVMDSAAAEDLTQETFVRAYRARHRYTPTAPPGAWLRRIGINLAISHRRPTGATTTAPRPETSWARRWPP
jgi:RNA polymerase sigma-70 factor (ECF subfamily)